MLRQIFGASCLASLLSFSLASCRAQTLSNCRPAPPMPPNVKPGVDGLSLSHDGKTLVVAGGDAKIRFVDMATGEGQTTLTVQTNEIYRSIFSTYEKLIASSSRD